MIPTRTTPQTASSIRYRRIGRKALQGDRLARALGTKSNTGAKKPWRSISLRPKAIAITAASFVIMGTLGFAGSQFYIAQATASQKAAVTKQQSDAKAKSIASDACRRKKVEQNAALIGKATYDELYGYGECDK